MAAAWETDADALRAACPGHILFLCVANSARSQMAEGIARSLAPASVKISSAGSAPSKLNPLAVKALDEIGVDIRSQYSKSVSDIPLDGVEAVVTLCAEEVCPVFLGRTMRAHWGLPDPVGSGKTEEEQLQRFREIRDELRRRLGRVFARQSRRPGPATRQPGPGERDGGGGNSALSSESASCRGRSALAEPTPQCRPRRLLALVALGLVAWTALYLVIEPAAGFLTRRVLGLSAATRLGSAVAFFLFEAPKVLLLLALVVFGVGIVRSFFTPERTRALLAGRRESVGNVLAALLGVVTPFCSCSAVPLFLGFVEVGIPLGVTLSFLISAPMVNEVALVLLFGLFGWRVAALYLVTGLAIAVVAGFVLGRLRLERWVEGWVGESIRRGSTYVAERLGFAGRVEKGGEAVRDVVGKVWLYVLVGIAVGALIHGYVPEGLLAGIMGKQAWWSVPLAVLVGVPMYSNAAGVIPVVQALLGKGAALGTVLAFMMSVIGLSLPEMIILRKVLKPQLIAAFVAVVAVGILAVGFLFNSVL